MATSTPGGAEHHHLGVGGELQYPPPWGEQSVTFWAWVVISTITPQEKQSIAVQAWAGVGHADAALLPWEEQNMAVKGRVMGSATSGASLY